MGCGRRRARRSASAEPGYLGEWHAFRQYARNVTGPAAERLIVWFEPDLLPGYMWSFPLPDGRANIGFGVQRNGVRRIADMKTEWEDLLQRPHIVEALGAAFELEDRHTAWPIPAGIDRATLTVGRVCFVGDAAMATDTMTGEGIGQALLTGRLAAEAMIAGGALAADEVAKTYRSTVRHHLLADHKMSALAQQGARQRDGRARVRSEPSPAASGPDATSPAGCSRTNPGRSRSPPPAGTATSSTNPAPTAR